MKKILTLLTSLSLGLIILLAFQFGPKFDSLKMASKDVELKKEITANTSDFDPTKIDFKNIFKPNVVVQAKESSISSKTTSKTNSQPKNEIVATSSDSSITISSIDIIEEPILKGTLKDTTSLYTKLLYYPVIESEVTPDLCSTVGNSYIYGHSEPPSSSESNFPASRIFSDLDKVKPGDLIQASLGNGKNCTYQVTKMDTLTTNSDQKVDASTFNFAYFPQFDKPSLTIQTCKKGSATTRLLLRAELQI